VIVVDTHVVVWLTIEPKKLPKSTAQFVAEARASNGGIAIADTTLWELAMLATLGRIKPAIPLGLYLRRVEQMFEVLPVTGAIAERSTQFSSAYPKDPADRLIGATASVHGVPLVTRDQGIVRSGEVKCVG
jgi:PIN domain nuclease of toxin-antitoxin system